MTHIKYVSIAKKKEYKHKLLFTAGKRFQLPIKEITFLVGNKSTCVADTNRIYKAHSRKLHFIVTT